MSLIPISRHRLAMSMGGGGHNSATNKINRRINSGFSSCRTGQKKYWSAFFGQVLEFIILSVFSPSKSMFFSFDVLSMNSSVIRRFLKNQKLVPDKVDFQFRPTLRSEIFRKNLFEFFFRSEPVPRFYPFDENSVRLKNLKLYPD